MKRKLSLLLLLIPFVCFSQKYKVDRMDGTNMKSMNMTITLSEDEIISDYGYGAAAAGTIYVIDVEEKDGKKYYYTQIAPPLTEAYYVVYTIEKRKKTITIIEMYMEMAGQVTNFKHEVSLIE